MEVVYIIIVAVIVFFVIKICRRNFRSEKYENYLSSAQRRKREGYLSSAQRRKREGYTEEYGGNQSTCETQCYSSQYYDACMHVCMEGSSADFTGRPDEYTLDALEAPIPLDEENGAKYYSTFAGPYRYETPGGQ